MSDQNEPLRAILDRATDDINKGGKEFMKDFPPKDHNQEDVGDKFSLLTEELCNYRLEVAKQLVSIAENHLRQVEAEVQETRLNARRKYEEYQALLRVLQDASSESMAVGRKLQNGMGK